MRLENCSYQLRSQLRRSTSKFSIDHEMNLYYPNSLNQFCFSLRRLARLTRSTKFLDRQCVRRSLKVSGGMLKTNYESNTCLLLETDLRWLLWRLGLLGRALKSGLWLMINCKGRFSHSAKQQINLMILFCLSF